MFRHKFDSDYMLVSFEENICLSSLYKKLVMKSIDSVPNQGEIKCVGDLDETNKSSFVKIMVRINTIENFFNSCTFYVRISTGPYY